MLNLIDHSFLEIREQNLKQSWTKPVHKGFRPVSTEDDGEFLKVLKVYKNKILPFNYIVDTSLFIHVP